MADIKKINGKIIKDGIARNLISELQTQINNSNIENYSLVKHTDGLLYIKKQCSGCNNSRMWLFVKYTGSSSFIR